MHWNSRPRSQKINDSDYLELKINFVDADVTKTLLLNPEVPIYQLCEIINKDVREMQKRHYKNYGLFIPHEDLRKGMWMEPMKTLNHYIIRRGDTLQYKNRFRLLHIRTMDGVEKEYKVDDSWTVDELMLTICTKLEIYNYEEYSLIREDKDKVVYTKRPLSWSNDQDKLNKMKRKLRIDDGFKWLDQALSLRQQGIGEKDNLFLKRKYFFSDMNVTSRDPIQLNLLYEQLKHAVINGAHPVTIDEGIKLAVIQCQVQFGDYTAQEFKSRSLELKEFLPIEYSRGSKNLEKKIIEQYSKLNHVSEVNAKEEYCLFCRSLKTYGITFFLVKEKVKGKNKLIPRLLGVNRDSVIQVDEKTKEIINKWPLTSIKKWAASRSGFTLDFGEYHSDQYYTAQTENGEKVSQLISGYIDIIMKQKKSKIKLNVDTEEDSIIKEEMVVPLKARIIEHVPKNVRPTSSEEGVVIRRSALTNCSSVRYSSQASDSIYSQDADMSQEGIVFIRQTSLARTQSPNSSITTNSLHFRLSDDDIRHKLYLMALQDHISTIETYKHQLTVNKCLSVTKEDEDQRRIFTNTDYNRIKMVYEIGALNVATAQILLSTRGLNTIDECEEEERKEEAIATMQNSFVLINIHLPLLIEEIKTATCYENKLITRRQSEEDLITKARQLSDAFTNMIQAAYPQENQNRSLNRLAIIEAATKVGEASSDLLEHVMVQDKIIDEMEVCQPMPLILRSKDEQCYQEKLLQLAVSVEEATTQFLTEVKKITVDEDNSNERNDLSAATTNTEIAISILMSTTKIVVPTIDQVSSQEQLNLSIQYVTQTVEIVFERAMAVSGFEEFQNCINDEAEHTRKSINDLMNHLNKLIYRNSVLENFLLACEDVQKLEIDDSDRQKLIDAAKKIAEATTDLIMFIQMKAKKKEDDQPQCEVLMTVSRQLENVTSELLESANNCIVEPNNIDLRIILKETIGRFIVITYSSDCADIIQQEVIDHLVVTLTNDITSSTHLINTSQSATKKSRANNYKVSNDSRELSNKIPNIIFTIKEIRQNPKDHLTQLELISAGQELLDCNEQLAQSSKYMWPTIADPSLQSALNQSIKQSVNATSELKKSLHLANYICQHLDLSAAIEWLTRLRTNLLTTKHKINENNLNSFEDEHQTDDITSMLIKSVKSCGLSATELEQDLISRALIYEQSDGDDKYLNLQNFDYAGRKSKDLASALDKLVRTSQAIASNLRLEYENNFNDKKETEKVEKLRIIDNCLDAVESSYELVRGVKIVHPDCNELQRIKEVSLSLSDAFSRCLDSLPGQRDIDIFQKHIEFRKQQFIENKPFIVNYQNIDYKDLQSELTDATFNFSQNINELSSLQNSNTLSKDCKKSQFSYDRLVDIITAMSFSIGNDDDCLNSNIVTNNDNIIKCVMIMSRDCQLFLQCVRVVHNSPDIIELRKELHKATRILLDSINLLLATSSSNNRPGAKECEKAIARMESLRPLLENPHFPVSYKDYYSCVELIVDSSESLIDGWKTVPLAVIADNIQQFIDSIYQCSESVYTLLEDASQSSYLIGIGNVHSKMGNKGLVDHSMFLKIQKEVSENCLKIINSETFEEQMTDICENISDNCKKLSELIKTVIISFPNDKTKLNNRSKTMFELIEQFKIITNESNSNGNQENRVKLAQILLAIEPAVNDIVELMLSCQFAGNTACISDEGKMAQGPINSAGMSVLDAAIDIVKCAKDLVSQQTKGDMYFHYSCKCKTFCESVNLLIATLKENTPGQRECDEALKLVSNLLKKIYESKIKVTKRRLLTILQEKDQEESYHKVLQCILYQMPHSVDDLSRAGKTEPEQLAHVLFQQTQLLESLTDSGIGAAAHTILIQNSTVYLEYTATVLEAVEEMIKATKKAGGNPQAFDEHQKIEESAQTVKESCQDLLNNLDKISFNENISWTVIDKIKESITKIQETVILSEGFRFYNYQIKMLEICYSMDSLVLNISENAQIESTERLLGPLSNKLAQNYDELCQASQGTAVAINDYIQRDNLQQSVKCVGNASLDLTKVIFDYGISIDSMVPLVQSKSQMLHHRIGDLIDLLININPKVHAYSDAIRILIGINIHITKCIKEHALSNEKYNSKIHNGHSRNSFNDIKDSTISFSEVIVVAIKDIVSNADLLKNETNLAKTISITTQQMSSGVFSYVDDNAELSLKEYNISLLNALHDVIDTLIFMLEEARNLSDLNCTNPNYQVLKEKGKQCVNAITGLLKILKSLEDEKSKDFHVIDIAFTQLEKNSDCLTDLIKEAMRDEGITYCSIKSSNRLSIASNFSTSSKVSSDGVLTILPLLRNVKDQLQDTVSPSENFYEKEKMLSGVMNCVKFNEEFLGACKNLVYNGKTNDLKINTLKTAQQIVDNYVQFLKNIKSHLYNVSTQTQNDVRNSSQQISELIKILQDNMKCFNEGPKLIMYFRPGNPQWRDVSEKYIGRHVTYHHCCKTSLTSNSKCTIHENIQIVLNLPINSRNPTDADVNVSRKQIRIFINKLREIIPNPNLITMSNCTVAEIEQILSNILNLMLSAESIVARSHCIFTKLDYDIFNGDLKKNIFRSIIGIAQALRALYDTIDALLTSNKISIRVVEKLSSTSKKVLNVVGQLLFNIKSIETCNDGQSDDFYNYAKKIRLEADLLLKSNRDILINNLSAKNPIISIDQVNGSKNHFESAQNKYETSTKSNHVSACEYN